ncbi:alpha-E domain-containing protein [Segnochrobactrum spirostomi]|uniref:Alpha-E domain-containing protein n=1 Tax=Segnochrobactrum spirostomi TaxID=2608987 RepID=A0A6A7XY88_9HYPH|nr:alpha-E domain-containing protein [Segnochrobactrum spirostomi]MQT11664.1 alpha-E domain-containing protein [Segnochrobactrum spirostomi]
MLSRTADTLYWLARYAERAENTARIVDAAARMSTLPAGYGPDGGPWQSAVASTGAEDLFARLNGEATQQSVVDFLVFSAENPSSIRSCLEIARANARAVRTALTIEMWEAINGAWIEVKRFQGAALTRSKLTEFLTLVKEACLRFDGSAYRTMLRDDAFDFFQIGVFQERADATARILDAKRDALSHHEGEIAGSSLDYFQLSSILRSVSALTSYHFVYRDNIKPEKVADLLILRRQMPRSLAACYENVTRHLESLSRSYGRQGPSQRIARATHARLQANDISSITAAGLHAFLIDFVTENNKLGMAITEQYLT